MGKRRPWTAFVPLWGAALLAGTAYGAGWLDGKWVPSFPSAQAMASTGSASTAGDSAAEDSTPGEPAIRASFGFCHTGGGTNCVVDGDTLWLGGQKIRVADIDAPETHPPRCAEEARLGRAATRRLQQLLNNGAVSLRPIDRDEDQYGRKLRVVLVDGRSVGDALVGEGLARRYSGPRRPWCGPAPNRNGR